MMNRLYLVFSIFLVLAGLPFATARAEGNVPPKDYQELTSENLFRLYWRTGYLKTSDEMAVIEYMQMTNCDLYKKFVKDDFNWPSILKATGAYLDKYASSFPYQFTLKQPIAFERYDVDKKWFKLLPSAAYLNVFLLQIADYSDQRNRCVSSGYEKHPTTAFIRMQRPLSITYVPMTEGLAREYIDFAGKLDQSKRVFVDSKAAERPAFVNFRFTVLRMEEERKPGDPAVFNALLDGYDIYADQGLSLLLYSWEPEKKAKKVTDKELVVDQVPAIPPAPQATQKSPESNTSATAAPAQ